ncbi:MAG: hypothetical protein KatS3mg091_648 [Patescibacteria group bacterium]|nr:MAG: hypothetical protein KatS3mg091_648 [Patescibacteria group bacterium]
MLEKNKFKYTLSENFTDTEKSFLRYVVYILFDRFSIFKLVSPSSILVVKDTFNCGSVLSIGCNDFSNQITVKFETVSNFVSVFMHEVFHNLMDINKVTIERWFNYINKTKFLDLWIFIVDQTDLFLEKVLLLDFQDLIIDYHSGEYEERKANLKFFDELSQTLALEKGSSYMQVFQESLRKAKYKLDSKDDLDELSEMIRAFISNEIALIFHLSHNPVLLVAEKSLPDFPQIIKYLYEIREKIQTKFLECYTGKTIRSLSEELLL